MGRLFITKRELQLISDINKELIKDIIGEEIIYHPVSEEKTKKDELYDEAEVKVTETPINIRCLVNWEGSTTETTNFGVDKKYSIEVYFHEEDLSDKNIKLREGDFVEYGAIFFEVINLGQPDLIYGQAEHKVMTKAICKSVRKGQFYKDSLETDEERDTFTQIAGDEDEGDRRELVEGGKIERLLDHGVTSPFTEDDDY